MSIFDESSRILVIAAHPDDEVLGCGGLLARFCPKCPVRLLIIGEGSTCRFLDKTTTEANNEIALRQSYLLESSMILGINDIKTGDFECGNFSSQPILNINRLIEANIHEFRPTHIFTHYIKDNNNDHRIVSRSTSMASRPKKDSSIKYLFHYEVLSSTEWNFSEDIFSPNTFINLSQAELSLKKKAMSKYISEQSSLIPSRGEDGITTLAKYRGLQSGFKYAEAFSLVRSSI